MQNRSIILFCVDSFFFFFACYLRWRKRCSCKLMKRFQREDQLCHISTTCIRNISDRYIIAVTCTVKVYDCWCYRWRTRWSCCRTAGVSCSSLCYNDKNRRTVMCVVCLVCYRWRTRWSCCRTAGASCSSWTSSTDRSTTATSPSSTWYVLFVS